MKKRRRVSVHHKNKHLNNKEIKQKKGAGNIKVSVKVYLLQTKV